jgi:type VI secretion system protein ImpC
MAKSISFGEVNLDVEAGRSPQPPKPQPETPFRIAVIGDFSGRANRAAAGGQQGSRPRPMLVDRDNLDEVMAKLGVRLSLRLAGEAGAQVELRFREIEDFEPDSIYSRAELFRTLRDARRRLADTSEFEKAAAELGLIRPGGEAGPESGAGTAKESLAAKESSAGRESPAGGETPTPDVASLTGGSLLEGALEATVERTRAASGAGGISSRRREDDLSEFLRRAVAPYAVADPHPKQGEVLSRWDQAINDQMRAVLHHPDYQALEAAWRGLHLLTRRLDTGAELKVYFIDCSKDELAEDLENCGDLRECRLAKALTDSQGDWAADPGWALFAGLFRFDAAVADTVLLARMAVVAGYLGAPFVSEAVPGVFGCRDLSATPDPANWKRPAAEAAESWKALRAMPQSRHLALAAPRFLLRPPYGEETVPAEEFPFEEVSVEDSTNLRHEDFLWGNPAVAIALMLGENFSRHGWDMRPGAVRELDGVPMFLYKQNGEPRQLPCAEAWLGERAAEAMLDYGVLPLLARKDRDAVVLFDLRSLSKGDDALAGPWDS